MNSNSHRSSRQVLGELETLLTQPTEPTREEVEAAHGAATIAIRNVNERLANAHQLIVAGRRAEAIEIAEGPPHVLDEIAVLDSQLIRDWEHWAGQFGLPRFAPLRSDLASLLNGAYTAENQLEHVLRRHRLLAIGRANLRQRIAVLNQLATADPSNPQWNRALIACQSRRLEQLAERATLGRKHKDLRCLKQVMAELRQTRWLTPVSKTQVDSVQKQITSAQRRESTTEAIAIAEHIQDAYAAGDQSRMAPLIQRWRKIAVQIDTAAMGDTLGEVRSIINWFDQEARQQREAEAQSQALNRIQTISADAQSDEIRSVIDSIASTGAEMPLELRDVYLERVQQETRARNLKTMLMTGTVAAVLIVAASLSVIAFRSYQHDAKLTKMLATIDEKLSVGDLDVAGQLLDAAPRDDQRFDEHRMRLTDKQLAEEQRAAEFQQSTNSLRKSLDEASEVEQFEALKTRINRLTDEAKKDDEFMAVKGLIEYEATCRQARKEVLIGEATQLIHAVREQLKDLDPEQDHRPMLGELTGKLSGKRTDRWLRAESDLLKELEATSNAVMDRRDDIRRMVDSKKELSKITDNVGNWVRWERLGADADEMEESVRGKFLAIARCTEEEKDLWLGVDQWNEIALGWTLDRILSATVQQSAQIKADVTKIRQAGLGDLPAAADFLSASEVALPTAARSQRNLELLAEHLQSPKMSEIGAIKTFSAESSSDRWHYFPADGKSLSLLGDRLRITHFSDLAMTKTEVATVDLDAVVVPVDFGQYRDDYISGNRALLAPHVPFCKDALRELGALKADLGQWDQIFEQLYRELLSAEQMDPLIRLFLANAVLDIGSRGSWRLGLAYAGHLKAIEDAKIGADVNWFDPADANALKARKQASSVLQKLKGIRPVSYGTELANLKRSLVIDTTYAPIGWLDQKGSQWLIQKEESHHVGPLYVRYHDGGASQTREIGQIADGKVQLNSADGAAMRVGRPVWVGMTASGPLE